MEGREREGPQVTVEPGSLSVLLRHCLLQRHVLQLLTHSTHLSQHLCTCTSFVSFAVFIYYFNCISFAIRLSGRKVTIKLIDDGLTARYISIINDNPTVLSLRSLLQVRAYACFMISQATAYCSDADLS